MKLNDFNYQLPRRLIAQAPVKPRDQSRLLVLKRKATKSLQSDLVALEHKHFFNLPDYLNRGDVLVLNNSRVFPARLIGKKQGTGCRIEVLLLSHSPAGSSPASVWREKEARKTWHCLLGGRGKKEGLIIEFGRALSAKVTNNNQDGSWDIKFNRSGKELLKIINQIGRTPLPPYIKRPDNRQQTADSSNYQTIYADDKKTGSVAAPTAGLHFTSRLIKKLTARGIIIEYITLHVGLGTFAPVKVADIKQHKMHAEWAEVSRSTIRKIIQAKQAGGRIVAVGTTSARALEALFGKNAGRAAKKTAQPPRSFSGWINLFIYPGYRFKIVDALITNFHLPKTTLLMLVCAFAGKGNIDRAYRIAVKQKYRFYSYGDVMLII